MAIGVAIAGVAVAAIQIGMSVKQKKEAERGQAALDAERAANPLTNAFGGMTVSTMGADRQLEQSQRDLSTSAEAISSAGSRGLSYLSAATNQSANVAADVAANLEAQETAIRTAQANDEVNIRNLEEQRFNTEARGYATLYAAGQSGVEAGVASAGNAAAVGATAYGNMKANKAATTPTPTTTPTYDANKYSNASLDLKSSDWYTPSTTMPQ